MHHKEYPNDMVTFIEQYGYRNNSKGLKVKTINLLYTRDI